LSSRSICSRMVIVLIRVSGGLHERECDQRRNEANREH
jgi:hypothetical protein